MANGSATFMATHEGVYLNLLDQFEAIAAQANAGLLAEARYLLFELEGEVESTFPGSPLHRRVQSLRQNLELNGKTPNRWRRSQKIRLEVAASSPRASYIRIADLDPPLQPRELLDLLYAISLLQNIYEELQGEQHHFIDVRCEANASSIWLELSGALPAVKVFFDLLLPWQAQHSTELFACRSDDEPLYQKIRRRWADRLILTLAPGLPESLHEDYVHKLEPALDHFLFSRLKPIDYQVSTNGFH